MPLSASATIGHPFITQILERTGVVTRHCAAQNTPHADVTILAKLACALSRARAVPLAA
jgi:hypothetical protein